MIQLPEAYPKGWRIGQTLVNFLEWCKKKYGEDCFYWKDEKTRKEYWKFIREMLKASE